MKNAKKYVSVLLAVLILTCAPLSGFIGIELPGVNFAHAEEVVDSGKWTENISWSIDGDGVLTLSGTGKMIRNPDDFLMGLPWEEYTVKSLVIEDGITDICESICHDNDYLESVVIPASVETIGNEAFSYCVSLKSITIPDGVKTVGQRSFYYCSSLADISIGDSVTDIQFNVFGETAYMNNEANWQNGVLYIDNHVIAANDLNGSYTIPDGTLTIAVGAFGSNGDLTSVTVPNSVTNIGRSAFAGCDSLTSITIPDSVTSIGDQVLYSCDSLKNVTIPDSVISIGNGAFEGCVSLTSVTIPDSVTSIGDYAFAGCDSLTSITIPDSVTSIGFNAFENTGYHSNTNNWENGILYLGNHLINAEYDVSGTVTVKDGTKSIANETFAYNNSITGVIIPVSMKYIGEGAFVSCDNIAVVCYKGSKTQWDAIAVGYNNESLKNAGMMYDWDGTVIAVAGKFDNNSDFSWALDGNGMLHIYGTGDMVIRNLSPWDEYSSSVESVIIENGVTSIGNDAFSDCDSLTNIIIPDSITSIGNSAFSGCDSLTNITIPNSVTNIGNYAFNYCGSLTSITIPNSVTSIGYRAFCYCNSLTSITIPAGVTIIGDSAFDSCDLLTSINADDANTSYTSVDGVLYNKDKTTLICYPKGKTNTDFAVPEGVTSIAANAFYSNDYLKEITIPASIANIGYCAFNGSSVTEVFYALDETAWNAIRIESGNSKLQNNINYNCSVFSGECGRSGSTVLWNLDSNGTLTISGTGEMKNYSGSSAAPWKAHCKKIKSIVIENGVTKIGNNAFLNCKNLASISIPDTVFSIGEGAFSYCESLTSITIPDKVTSIQADTFGDCTSLANIVLPNGLSTIGEYAFINCKSLKNIKLPNSLTSINTAAFAGCTALENVILPDDITRVAWYAFENCTSMKSIIIPTSLTDIATRTFRNCNALTDVYYKGSQTDWESIKIADENDELLSATIHYNYDGTEKPVTPEDPSVHTHDYKAVVTAPTVATKGYTTYTCACGNSYVGEYTDPIKTEDAFLSATGALIGMEKTAAADLLYMVPQGAKLQDANGKDKTADEKVGTGDKLVLADGTEIVISVLGDLNGDGEIATADARLVLRKAVNLETFTAAQDTAAKVDGGEKVDVAHARKILRASVNLENAEDWYKALAK